MNNNEEFLKNKRKRDKEKLINEIEANFKPLEEIFKTEEAKNIFDSIGIFSFEEYSKFFQNLSNKEYTSMSEHPRKNKEPISIDKSKLKFDYTSSQKYDEILPPTKDILKSNLESKGISKKIKENLIKIFPKQENNIKMDIYLRAVSENISNLLISRSELNPKDFKQLIKIYSTLIRIKDNIYFEQDKYFYQLLQKFLDKSFSNFLNLSSFWLYTEFLLLFKKDNKDNKDNKEINIYKKYNEILKNIIQILNKLLNNNDTSIINDKVDIDFKNFISNIPMYNKTFINFLIKYHRLYLEQKSDIINDKLKLKENRGMTIYEALPYLENMKNIYINVINDKNLIEPKDKDEIRKNLLENFLIMTRNKTNFNAKALSFVFNDIYVISKTEEDRIKKFALEGLEEIKNLNEDEKNKIEQRFFFYFCLCGDNKENISKLPSVYSEVSQSIKDFMNPFIEKLLFGIEQYSAEGLINECNEKSEDIVISVIKNIYGNPNYKCEKNIEDEKLYRNIKLYYMKYCPNLTKGVIELSNKIPINDFFTNYNFILNKIKQYENENKQEIIKEIFDQLNSEKINKNIFGNNIRNFYDNIHNKIFFYILYYIQNIKNIKNDEFKLYKDLMIKYHIKKIIGPKNEEKKIEPNEEVNNKIQEEKNININDKNEYFKNNINNIANQLIKDNNINLLDILNLYDNYKDNIKNINGLQNEEIDSIINEFDNVLINIINEKLPIEQNNKLLEEYYNKLTQENKKLFKDKILKNISNQAKGTLDLITFGDI